MHAEWEKVWRNLGIHQISKNGLQTEKILKISAEFYCYINLLSDKHLIWIVITNVPENQGTKIYRIEKSEVPRIQEPALRHREVLVITNQGKNSSGLAVFTKSEKCDKKYWNLERAMDRTDNFTWEDLPTIDADSGT